MATAAITVDKVFTKSGENRKGEWTRYDVKEAGGDRRFQTFVHSIGRKAQQHEGRPVTVTFEEVDNNGYTNLELKSLEPLEAETGAVHKQDEFRRSKDEMRRTEAFKAAATIIASPGWEGEANLDALVSLGDAIADELAEGPKVVH